MQHISLLLFIDKQKLGEWKDELEENDNRP